MFTDALLIALLCQMATRPAPAPAPMPPDVAAAVNILRDHRSSGFSKVEACRTLSRAGHAAKSAELDLIRAARGDGMLHDDAVKALLAVDDDAPWFAVRLLSQHDDDANAAADALADMGLTARPVVIALTRLSRSDDFCVCRRALTVLEGLGPVAQTAAPDLRVLMFHPAWEVRYAATNALVAVTAKAEAQERQQVMRLCEPLLVLRDENSTDQEKVDACMKLFRLGQNAKAAAFDLAAAAATGSQTVRDAALDAMNAIGTSPQIARLPGAIAPRSSNVVAIETANLSAIDRKTPITVLRRLLNDPRPRFRQRSAEVLAEKGPEAKQALGDVRMLLGDPDANVRLAAIEAIASIDKDADVELLKAMSDIYVAQPGGNEYFTLPTTTQLCESLRVLGDRAARGADISETAIKVGRLLFSSNVQVQEQAAATLAQASRLDLAAIAALRVMYANPLVETKTNTPFGRAAILATLVRVDASNPQTKKEVRAAMVDTPLGNDAAEAIARDGKSAAWMAPQMLSYMTWPDPVRTRAAIVLAGIAPGIDDPKPVVNVMAAALTDENRELRSIAAATLGKIGAPAKAAIPKITAMLASAESSDVIAAANALAAFGPDANDAVPKVAAMLRQRMKTPPGQSESADAARGACAEFLAKVAPTSTEAHDLLLLSVQQRDWLVRERLAPAIRAANQKPADLVPQLIALADRSPDSVVRINARCALRELGERAPGDAQ